METINSIWQIGIIALVAGALIGVLAYRLLGRSTKETEKIKTELESTREELIQYKASVNQHFDKTSELVNDLTQNYVRVYQHLAEGAQTLGDSKTFNNLLEQHKGRVSIAVDVESKTPDVIVDDKIVVAPMPPDVPVETVDEHAEPFDNLSAAETVADSPVDDPAKTDSSKSSDEPDSPTETQEPVLNVDALEEAIENDDLKAQEDAITAMPESEKKDEVRTTTH